MLAVMPLLGALFLAGTRLFDVRDRRRGVTAA
jgi:hypothetical protein